MITCNLCEIMKDQCCLNFDVCLPRSTHKGRHLMSQGQIDMQ